MINKKAIGLIGNMLIALMLFSAVLIGVSSYIGSGINNYNLSSNPNETLSTFSRMSEIEARNEQMKGQLEGGDISIFDSFELFLTGAYQALINALSLPDLIGSIAEDLSGEDGIYIPNWFIGVITGIIVILVIFTIISAGFKHQV